MPSQPVIEPVESCPECGIAGLERERIRAARPRPVIEAIACPACGEWWFEAAGARITTEAIIRLGLHD